MLCWLHNDYATVTTLRHENVCCKDILKCISLNFNSNLSKVCSSLIQVMAPTIANVYQDDYTTRRIWYIHGCIMQPSCEHRIFIISLCEHCATPVPIICWRLHHNQWNLLQFFLNSNCIVYCIKCHWSHWNQTMVLKRSFYRQCTFQHPLVQFVLDNRCSIMYHDKSVHRWELSHAGTKKNCC